MTLATSQSEFRANMKYYMDSVVKEKSTVYIVRGKDSLVLSKQEIYNLLVDYANAEIGSLNHAILYNKLVEAGIIKCPPHKTYTKETLHEYFEEIANEANQTI